MRLKTPRRPVLVTGGAGYIGSHTVLALCEVGYPVVVLDNLSTGCRDAVPGGIPLVEGDIADRSLVSRMLREHQIAAVVHCAASTSVPGSMRDPLQYYSNNSAASTSLVRACIDSRVWRFVFTSTASVYGVPHTIPISEDAPTHPVNPYGYSKLVTERVLHDTAAVHEFRYIALRCFNVAGAGSAGRAGSCTGHLIETACEAAVGLRDHVAVFGTDYETADGTCVRDYTHVSDLAAAHVHALCELEEGCVSGALNCGCGHGFSVLEVLEAVRAEAQTSIATCDKPRRAGDPPVLIAETSRIRQVLDWSPRFSDLGTIVRTVLAEKRRETLVAG